MPTYTVSVTGMVCSNCEETVCRTVEELDGVSSVTADADAGEVVVECPRETRDLVCDRIDGLGFVVEG